MTQDGVLSNSKRGFLAQPLFDAKILNITLLYGPQSVSIILQHNLSLVMEQVAVILKSHY